MAEYIEREAALKRFTFATLDCLGMEPTIMAADVVKALKAIPAADVVPVVRGKWVQVMGKYDWMVKCSRCKGVPIEISNYCPNCGARMKDGDGDV